MTSIYPSTTTSSSTTATSSTASSSILRISGMASGIDTDAVVKSMVSSFQLKIDKANQDKQTMEWQQDAYRGIITGIKGLQDYFDPLSSKYMLTGNSFNVNSATNSDPSIVTGTSTASSQTGTYKVGVQQLAEQAKISGSSLSSMITVADPTKWSGATLTLGSTPITLGPITDTNSNGTSLDEVVANINSKIAGDLTLKGTVSASYVSDTSGSYIKFTSATPMSVAAKSSSAADLGSIASTNSGVSSSSLLTSLGFTSGVSTSFQLTNGSTALPTVSLAVNATTTIQDLMDSVNSITGGLVTMSLDDTTGKISFQSKSSGSTSNLSITDMSGDLGKLKITSGSSASGKDAIVSITAPGQTTPTITTQSSNKFTVNGVSYNLVGVNSKDETSNVIVSSNSDTVLTNVKSFITDYNTIISTINTKLTEKKDSDYPPLTDAQKTSMSDTQITAWEEKAKVGVLRNDDYLSSLMTQLRGTLYAPVYSDSTNSSTGTIPLNFGAYGTGSIGIQTSTDVTDGGKLVITDEAKLKDAIVNHMDDFKSLFIGSSTKALGTNESYIGSSKYKEDGIFKRMDTIIRDYVGTPGVGDDGTSTLNGYMNILVNKQYDFSTSGDSGKNTLPDQVYAKTLSVAKLQTQLSAASTRYYAQFTALETAMNTLNTQQSSLTAMLGTSSS